MASFICFHCTWRNGWIQPFMHPRHSTRFTPMRGTTGSHRPIAGATRRWRWELWWWRSWLFGRQWSTKGTTVTAAEVARRCSRDDAVPGGRQAGQTVAVASRSTLGFVSVTLCCSCWASDIPVYNRQHIVLHTHTCVNISTEQMLEMRAHNAQYEVWIKRQEKKPRRNEFWVWKLTSYWGRHCWWLVFGVRAASRPSHNTERTVINCSKTRGICSTRASGQRGTQTSSNWKICDEVRQTGIAYVI